MNEDMLDLDFENPVEEMLDDEVESTTVKAKTFGRRQVEEKVEELRMMRLVQDYDFA